VREDFCFRRNDDLPSFGRNSKVTRDYYKIMEIVYRAFKQPNTVAKITGLISNVTHRLNCMP